MGKQLWLNGYIVMGMVNRFGYGDVYNRLCNYPTGKRLCGYEHKRLWVNNRGYLPVITVTHPYS